MEIEILHKHHNDFGHFGLEKTHALIQETYWLPKMKAKIKSHIMNCLECIVYSKSSGKPEGFRHGIPKGSEPFVTIHVDHYGPVDRSHATKRYVFLVIDAFTKYVKLYAVKTTTSRETIRCLKEYFFVYSRPKRLI